MPAGRPTKYTTALLDKARDYLKVWDSLDDKIPSHIALQDYIGLSNTCMYEWSNDPEKIEFKEILQSILHLQQRILLNNGLDGTFNSNITKLVLGKHGFSEKREQETTHNFGDEFLEAIKPTTGLPSDRD